VKEEAEQPHYIPPSGSVDNPMEVDDSDDEIIVQCSAVSPKRKKTGMVIANNPLLVAELAILAPPPGRETPGKRSRLEGNHASGSSDPPPATSQAQVVPVDAPNSPTKPVRCLACSFKADVTHPFRCIGFIRELQVETPQRR